MDANEIRARRAVTAMEAHRRVLPADDDEETVQDLLADLMQLCRERRLDFDARLGKAQRHFDAELRGDDDTP